MMNRSQQSLCAVLIAASVVAVAAAAQAEPAHGIAMHGSPKYATDFTHLDYANPDAPQGGTLRLAAVGSFDSLNPHIVMGKPAAGLSYIHETLLRRVWDEPFTLYGAIAETVEVPDDRAWVAFTLREEAHFSDGTPITVDDVIFSLETIRTHGRPNSRATYEQVVDVQRMSYRTVKLVFEDNTNRELPLLIGGFLPILSKAYWSGRDFTETTLEPPVGSGPYVIETVDPGRSIVYRRDPNYWGNDLALSAGHFNFDEIRYEYYRDAGVSLEAFKAGDYDQRYEFNANRWETGYDFPAAHDGRVVLKSFDHGIASGLRGIGFNLRRPLFQDRRVRRALALAFDFEWINKNLLRSAYERTASIYDNSVMAPDGPPSDAELRLLEPWRDQLPPEVFGPPYAPPVTDGSGGDRRNQRAATALLREAGWQVADGKLVDADGQPFRFEIMLRSQSNEKIALSFKNSLERLGIDVDVRLVDSTQYQARLEAYDFDMAIRFWGVSLSPGSEQQNYWGSVSAASPGSRNEVGVTNPAIDAMIEALMGSRTREDMVTAARAIDRVIMWEQYSIPLYHRSGFRVAHWSKLGYPETIPIYGPVIEAWWAEPR